MGTKHRRHTSGRGGSTLRVSALGLAVALAAGVAAARSTADTPQPERVTAHREASLPAFVVEPAVRLATAEREGRAPAAPVRRTQGVPRWVEVPRLGVEAPVVGVDAPDGVLLPPSDPTVLGWWRGGARPGAALGSALITGHTVSSGGGAFDDLEKLGRGDRVRVRTTGGGVDYEVTGVAIYRKAGLAKHAARVFSQSVPGRLVLVTCEDWNGSAYLSNAVVFAEPVA